jgi:tetratricopeptide (TPR) repeat protein
MEAQALWLLRRTWKSYRSPGDMQGKSYARYNYNYGISLLDMGFIRNPISLAEDMNNLREWKEHADQNAYEYFARSYASGKLLAAGGQLASVLAYRGEVGKAITLVSIVTDEALARNATLELCDAAIASVVIYDIVWLFDPAAIQLYRCLEIAKELGDEPRRAVLSAHLGRFLTYGGQFDEADKFISEADRIGRRLDLQPVLLASQAARGRWLTDSEKSDEDAVRILQEVVKTLHSLDDVPLVTRIDPLQPETEPILIKGRHPTLCRVLLDLNRAASFAGNAEVMDRTLDELDKLATEVFPGYCPHYYLSYAECLLTHGAGDQRALVADLISRARRMGELSGNPWVPEAADRLEQHIGRGQ